MNRASLGFGIVGLLLRNEPKRESWQPKGEEHYKAILTPDIVRQIRAAEGTHREIAQRFGIGHASVWKIKTRQIWASVE